MRSRLTVITAVGVLGSSLLLATPGLVSGQDASTPTSGSAILDPDIDLIIAQEIALEPYPDASVIAIALDGGSDALLYSVTLDSGVEVQVDATTGAIVADHVLETAQEAPRYVLSSGNRLQSRAAISVDEAVAAAQAAIPDAGPVREIELEIEDGRLLYQVDFGRYEVYVDAQSGAIVEIDRNISIFGS
ncbi:MAG: PepSY domain-containing protein [Thermomicrobiales bacterium]|nr:PepSY domain-containing protein [Thermomicrobiales bacterium]